MGCPFVEHREHVASFVAARDRAAAQPDDMGYALVKTVRLDQLKRARARADRAARNIAHALTQVCAFHAGLHCHSMPVQWPFPTQETCTRVSSMARGCWRRLMGRVGAGRIDKMATKKANKNPVLVTTAHRGVFFGYLIGAPSKAKVLLSHARNCVSWERSLRGVFGLAESGPSEQCRVGPSVETLTLFDITAVATCTPEAAAKWEASPWVR